MSDVHPLYEHVVQRLLMEGGAYGHLSHMYEAHDLTFGEILEIFRLASEGKLENVTEKTDGINMFFTVAAGELKIATNPGMVRTGGMNREAVVTRFADKPEVGSAYVSGYDALAETVNGLSKKERARFFGGPGGQIWYSIEVMSSKLPGTIRYGRNILSVHMNGSKIAMPDGSEMPGDSGIASELGAKLASIGSSGDWEVTGAAMVQLPVMSKKAYQAAARRIRTLGVSDQDTIEDYLLRAAEKLLSSKGVKGPILPVAAQKMIGAGQPPLPTLKSKVPAEAYAIMRDAKTWMKQVILPLEDIITDFTVERLRGIESVLVDDSTAEVARLKNEVERAIAAIHASGDETALRVLEREMVKLKSVDNIVSPSEGIVFHYKGRVLKLTGAFSSFHQILSLFKFGRGGKVLKMESRLVTEGGNAFDVAEPVSLANFNREYPKIVHMLKSVGVIEVGQVGSTGKKPLMGDVDLAVESNMNVEELETALVAKLGRENVRRNATVISFVHRFGQNFGQVDLMTGKIDYLSWARAGTDPRKTPFKGVARNMLLNALTKALSTEVFRKSISKDGLDQKRYTIDFDRGLFVSTQTRRGKNKPLADWKTISRELVSDHPDEIVTILLGQDFTSDQVVTFEGLMDAIARSPLTRSHRKDVVQKFLDSVKKETVRRPDLLGPDTSELVKMVEEKYL